MTASLLESTTSRHDVRVGDQQPRVSNVPPYVSTIGDEVSDFMAQIGKPVLPWQRHVLRGSFGIRKDGKWAAYEVTLLKARQNGKGVITEAQELGGLFLLKEKKIIHSAHLFDTSREAFDRLIELIDGSDWLRSRTNKVNQAHGKEGIELTRAAGGGKLKFKARTQHGTRGFSGDRIILDEAYGLTVAQMQAMSPVLATLPNAQITYTSSPPDDQTGPLPDDAMLPSIRARGIDGDPQMAFYEWSPPPGFDAADVDVWYRCNASLGYLIEEEYLHRQFRIFASANKIQSFATEHLGDWPKAVKEQWQVLTKDDWERAEDPDSASVGRIVFAVAVARDRSASAIAVAGVRADGDLHAELVDHRPGTSWVVGRVVDLVKRWKPARVVADVAGTAAAIAVDLTKALADPDLAKLLAPAKVELVGLAGREISAGFAMVVGGISTDPESTAEEWTPAEASDLQPEDADEDAAKIPVRRLRIRPHPTLTAAVAAARTRPAGRGVTWEDKDRDASSIGSVTHAVHGLVTCPDPEPDNTVPLVAWR